MNHTIELPPQKEQLLTSFAEKRNLTPDQLLREIIDDSLALLQPETTVIPQWHKDLLDERLADYYANPDDGEAWSKVKQELLGD